jgi:hypothetical protein
LNPEILEHHQNSAWLHRKAVRNASPAVLTTSAKKISDKVTTCFTSTSNNRTITSAIDAQFSDEAISYPTMIK